MRKYDLFEMESVIAGDAIDSACAGFGAVAAVYTVGVLANWWNPIGWGGTVAGAIIGVGCAAYTIR